MGREARHGEESAMLEAWADEPPVPLVLAVKEIQADHDT